MTKPDWAYEAAEGLLDQITGHPDFSRANINFLATALRKAKADGMREASDALMRADQANANGMGIDIKTIAIHFRYAADQIEGGQ